MPNNHEYIYIKFFGSYADEGKIDLGKAGKTLSSFDRWTKKYKKDFLKPGEDFVLRANAIQKNCTEIQIALDFVKDIIMSPAGTATALAIGGKVIGFDHFVEGFMHTVGNQLALKMFSKGKPIHEESKHPKNDGKIYVKLINQKGDVKEVSESEWLIYKETNSLLNGFYNLEEGKEEQVHFGYNSRGKYHDVAKLNIHDRESFIDWNDPDILERRMAESFDESKATDVKIIGKFIDYHALAHRYNFSFQARKNQDVHGKQKILCIVEMKDVPKILDLLKPDHKKNICIQGKAILDRDGKIDKIKLEWFNEDPDFNPDQVKFV